MSLFLLRLLLDFGLVVLIWIIQLVVYPSFNYYGREQLLEWHEKYTTRITFVVMPLMLGQLVVAGIQLWISPSWYTIGSMGIIVLLWLSTFLQFVPLHGRISDGDFTEATLVELVRKNWVRTFLWTLLFLLGVVLDEGN